MIRSEKADTQQPLLKTKLIMPRIRPNGISRPRLLGRLNTIMASDGTFHQRLTLIQGPAGYGKTTLACQWIQTLPQTAAWLSLDQTENDETRFFRYLLTAVASVQEEVGENALARLDAAYPYPNHTDILIGLLNDLAISEPLVLVLDDYHLIKTDRIHELVSYVLHHAPATLHMVIISRTEPPLPIAWLRAQGLLSEINLHELRFTAEETTQFLHDTMGIALTIAQVDQLDAHIEGWVTGLQLAALTLQEQAPLNQAFSGNQRYLVDYLGDQVLQQQTTEVKQFLLQTAILGRFCASLCAAVLDIPAINATQILEQIERANLFLISLDAERQWYRYHHVFSEYLNGRLQQTLPSALCVKCHQRAAQWYQANGYTTEAVDHALAAADYPLATDLILEVSQDMLMYGEGNTLRDWIEQLPAQYQTAHGRLRLFYAWSLTRTGDFNQANDVLESIEDQLDSPTLRGEWYALRARLAVMTRDRADVNIHFSNKALSQLLPDQRRLRSEISINLGFSHWAQSDLDAAQNAFATAAQNMSQDPGLWGTLYATYYWAKIKECQADLTAAFDIYQHGLEIAQNQQRTGREPSPAIGFMHIGIGWLLYEWNRLDEAEHHLRQAVYHAERCGDFKMGVYAFNYLAQCLAAKGISDEANVLLDRLEQHMRAEGPSLQRAAIAMQSGQTDEAEQWATYHQLKLSDTADKVTIWREGYRELARLRLLQGRYQGLLRAIHLIVRDVESGSDRHFLILILLLQAIAEAKQGDMETAVATMRRILSMAQSSGYIRIFIDHPDRTVPRMLHQIASQNGIYATYAQQLITHLATTAVTHDTSQTAPLSAREIEVLQYLASGLSNRAISEQMVVSINTVKTHTRRLYDKLDVHNRTQAVARARELQLIE